jgi:nucleoside phosphorylase
LRTVKESFLSQFDSGMFPHIMEFGKRLADIKAEIFVLMARKAACFIECLEGLNLTSLNGIVTTDRILDMNTDWFKNKRVAIIDDALISGTTLYQTVRKIRKAGAAHVSIHVVCVSKEWWSRALATPSEPYLELTDQQTTSFCANVVDALSLYPRPYAVDFPIFNNVRIKSGEFDELSTVMNWETYDLSSSLQRDHQVFSLTAVPTAHVLSELDQNLGWDFSSHSQLLKVRVYGKAIDAGRKTYWCHLMPLIALDPLKQRQVNDLWEAITSNSRLADREFINAFTSVTSRLRLIQYIVSTRLGILWLNYMGESLGREIEIQQDPRTSSYLFTPQVIDTVRRIAKGKQKLFRNVRTNNSRIDVPAKAPTKRTKFINKDTWSLQARLTEPFLDFYRSKELKARQLALRYGVKAFESREYREIMNRLETGISLPQLRSLLSDVTNIYDSSKMVSLFIDLANDRGIVVPVITTINGTIFRAYRHGEDVQFTESEARLCCQMLMNFAKASGRKALPHLWTEKMLVLLIRIGVHKQFLTRWNGTLGEEETIGIRYSLKGAVAQANAPKLYEYNPEGGLTALFLESGYLTEDKEKGMYKLCDAIPKAPTKEGAEIEAMLIGSLFGTLLSNDGSNGKPRLNEDELTLLATCLYPNDAAGALAASINIFSSLWKWRVKKYRASEMSKTICDELLEQLRSHVTFEAINSGAWKFRYFNRGVPWQTIERIGNSIADPVYAATWKGFWPSIGQRTKNAASVDLKALIEREGVWCLKANVFMRMVEVSLRYVCEDELLDVSTDTPKNASAAFEKALQEIQQYCKYLEPYEVKRRRKWALPDFIRTMIERIEARTLNANALRHYAIDELEKLVAESRSILDLVDTIVTAYGNPKRVNKYPHAMYIEIQQATGRKAGIWRRAHAIISKYRNMANKQTGKKGVRGRIDLLSEGKGPFGQGQWACSTGGMGRSWLVRLAKELCYELSAESNLRFVLMTHLPDDEQLMRAVATSQYNGKRFWNLSRTIIDEKLPKWTGTQLFIFTPPNKTVEKAIEEEVLHQGETNLRPLNKPRKITIDGTLPVELSMSQYSLNSPKPVSKQNDSLERDTKIVDVGIITIVTEEMVAARNYLAQSEGFRSVRGKRSRKTFYEGSIPRAGGGYHSTVAVQQLDQGNRSVVSTYDLLVKEYAPALVVLLGIGGAIHKDVDLCDVVVADQIVYYDKRKVTDQGTKHRGEGYKVASWLKELLNNFFVISKHEPAVIHPDNLLPQTEFRLHRGPIGSGEAVVGYREAEERKWLVNYNDKTLVLETEAGGLAEAFYEDQLSYDEQAVGYLIIRGVSDHADHEKDDKWRQIASDNAMTALVRFLSTIPDIREFVR